MSLSGFGLSDYESRAYITLIRRGSLSISEVSFFTGIPRQKCYVTIQRLARKQLARIMDGRPVRCQAVSPEKSLGGLIKGEEAKLEEMKRNIADLNKLIATRSDSLPNEGKTMIIPSKLLGSTTRDLLSSSKQGARCIFGGWGAGITSVASSQFTDMIVEGKIQVILGDESFADGEDEKLLDVARICKIGGIPTMLIVDEEKILVVGNTEGTGLLIESRVLAAILISRIFQPLWRDSIPVRTIIQYLGEKKAINFKKLDPRRVDSLFIRAVSESSNDGEESARIGKRFLELLAENLEVNFLDCPIEQSLDLMTSLMLRGSDDANGNGETNARNSIEVRESPWSFGMAEILRRSNHPRIQAR